MTFFARFFQKEIISEVLCYPEKASILIKLNKKCIKSKPVRKNARILNLNAKKEFHCTVIGNKTGNDILESCKKIQRIDSSYILDLIFSIARNKEWEIKFNNEYYHITKVYENENGFETRESIIQTCQLIGLNDFYQTLKELFTVDFQIPFTHVTLFTNSTKTENKLRGIGINSIEEFESLHPSRIL